MEQHTNAPRKYNLKTKGKRSYRVVLQTRLISMYSSKRWRSFMKNHQDTSVRQQQCGGTKRRARCDFRDFYI